MKKKPDPPVISVIIPVYKTEPFLRRCLDSVIIQTLRNIEIICVNDASPDRSLDILREYADMDNRIKIINFTENRGTSDARNAGIDVSRGKYLGFVDSDDMVAPDFYEKLYVKAYESGAVIVKGDVIHISETGEKTTIPSVNAQIRENHLNFSIFFHTAIYQTRQINENSIRFPSGVKCGEDTAFLTKAVCMVKRVEIVDDACYIYCRRKDSAFSRTLNREHIFFICKAFEDIAAYINERDLTDSDYATLYTRCIFGYFTGLDWLSPDLDLADIFRFCADFSIKLYVRCNRRAVLDNNYLEMNYPLLHKFLIVRDAAGMAEYLTHNNKRIKFLMNELRAKVIRGKEVKV